MIRTDVPALDHVLERLTRPYVTPRGYRADCPACNHPGSLLVTLRGARPGFECNYCCDPDLIHQVIEHRQPNHLSEDKPIPFSEVKPTAVEWIWPGWIPAGMLTVIAGDPGAFKSGIAISIAARLSKGLPMQESSHSPFSHSVGRLSEHGSGLGRGPHSPFSHEVGRLSEHGSGLGRGLHLPFSHSVETEAFGEPSPKAAPQNGAEGRLTAGRGPINSLLMLGDDDLAATVRPRLDAAGADVDRIFTYRADAVPSLRDIYMMEGHILDNDIKLVIIDPLNAFIPANTDSNSGAGLRALLSPLKMLAENTGAAIVIITPLNKGGGANALYRTAGSIDLVAAARSAILCAKLPNSETDFVFASIKNNLIRPPRSLRYHVESADGVDRSGADSPPIVVWNGVTEETANSVLGALPSAAPKSKIAEAREFLLQELSSGPVPTTDIERRAAERGIADTTLKRARQGVADKQRVSEDAQGGGHWEMSLSAEGINALRDYEASKSAQAANRTSPEAPNIDGRLGPVGQSGPLAPTTTDYANSAPLTSGIDALRDYEESKAAQAANRTGPEAPNFDGRLGPIAQSGPLAAATTTDDANASSTQQRNDVNPAPSISDQPARTVRIVREPSRRTDPKDPTT